MRLGKTRSFQFFPLYWMVVLLMQLCSVMSKSRESNVKCDGPPYIYATTHHQVKNVLKYSRNGCLLDDEVLVGGHITEDEDHRTELRSMAFGRYKDKESLYVADASTRNSSILVYSDCDSKGHRQYLARVTSSEEHPAATHAYGICLDYEDNVYASFQHSDSVLRFSKDDFQPMKLPSALSNDYRSIRPWYPGTFVQFGQPKPHSPKEQGIRSIAVVYNNLWVANKDIGGVAIYPLNTGLISNIVVVESAIGLHYNTEHDLVFVGSKMKHWQGAVYAIEPHTLQRVRTYTTGRMNHPTGITSYKDDLFVAEQTQNIILKFSIKTGAFVGVIVKEVPGEVEQIIMSNC